MTKPAESERPIGDRDLLDRHRRNLKRAGVRIVAIPKKVGHDADGDLART